jgi:hypothetical protein
MTVLALFPTPASAISAWGRKYDVPCSTCHFPAPPRLNVYGEKFRRAGYRTPEEFNKDVDWKSVSDYIGMRVRARYEYDSPEDGFGTGMVTNTFTLADATLFYAGPVGKHFNGFVELERPGNDAEIEAVVSIGGIYGSPDSFWTFRIGQFHSLVRVGWGGLDRPTGISTPIPLSRALVAGDAYKINQDQVGLEGAYVFKNSRFFAQILNGADLVTASTTDHVDQNRQKDWMVGYELLWGDMASGLSAFYYDGTQDDPASAVAPDKITFNRYGVTAAQVWKNGFEVQGGFVQGKDDYSIPVAAVDSVTGQGYWVELMKYWESAHDLSIFGRYETQDPDTDTDDDVRTAEVVGLVWPVASWHVRWALEFRNISQETTVDTFSDKQAVAEIMLNF